MARQNVKRWSRRVTEKSNALDLEPGVFARTDPRSIARSLKRSAERSRRRKSDPFRSAMSMLNFYINRDGRTLPKSKRTRLEKAKEELRDLYRRSRPGAALQGDPIFLVEAFDGQCRVFGRRRART